MRFADFGLAEPVLRGVAAEGYTEPTPIQIQAIPHVLAGRDLLGCAQTGTGKTAAFALPILHRLGRHGGRNSSPCRRIRALVLSPTRELAVQIGESFSAYGRYTGMRYAVVHGGVSQNPQTDSLRVGVDVLIATPGRLLDLMTQGFINLRGVEIFVLDEGDRMLDMGFIPDVRRIIARLPTHRQTLLFSATIPRDIRRLADSILHDPVSVHVAPESVVVDTVDQSVYFVDTRRKPDLLLRFLRSTQITRVLVFTRTKHGADRVMRHLRDGNVCAEVIHGDKTQGTRQRALGNFRSGATRVLVATDIAARGLDIDNVSHVVNYDVPNVPETYVHRIGRTARMGASGVAVSFCGREERSHLRSIERMLRRTIHVAEGHPDDFSGPDRPPRHNAPRHHPSARKPAVSRSAHRSEQPHSSHGHDQESGRRHFWSRRGSRHHTRTAGHASATSRGSTH